MVMTVAVDNNKQNETKTLDPTFRTSVTVIRDDFDLFKDICKNKYPGDPVNTGIQEAIADFNIKNKEHLSDKYAKMKKLLEWG